MSKKPKDQFAFEEGQIDQNVLASLSKKLSPHLPKAKDSLLKLLKQLSSTLEAAPQDASSSSLGKHGEPIAHSILDSAILNHPEKDVKLSTAYSIIQLLRIYAPNTPYTDEQLRDIFKLLCWVFERLACSTAPTFEICQSILQQTEQVKLYMLLLDLNDPMLVVQVFESLLGAARADNLEAIEFSTLEILSGLVEELEAETLDEELLAVMLKALLGIGYDPAAHKIMQRLLQRCEEQLRSSLQRFTTALLTGTTTSNLRPECMRVIKHLYQCTPQVLLPVLPHLHTALEAQEEGLRLAATELLVSLLCMPESDIAEHFPKLAGATLQRYRDVGPSIRVFMLEHTSKLATLTHNASIREQVLSLATDRLQDMEEKVRLAALQNLSSFATSHSLHGINQRMLDGLCGRLRDTKLTTRKEAATAMATMFRALAANIAKAGGLSDAVDANALSIPGRLSGAAMLDLELRPHIHAILYNQGILPAGMPADTAAQVWALVWADRGPKDRELVLRLLRSKTELQRAVAVLLRLRQELKAKAYGSEEEQAALSRRVERACSAVLDDYVGSQASAADSRAKSLNLLRQLLEVKDGRVFDRLAAVCDPLAGERETRDARKDAVERVGSKSPLGVFLSALTAALAPTLISPATLAALTRLGCPLLLLLDEDDGSRNAAKEDEQPPRKKQRPTSQAGSKPNGATTPPLPTAARPSAKAQPAGDSKGGMASSGSEGRAAAAGAALASAARVLVGGASKVVPALCLGLVGQVFQVVMLWTPPKGVELQRLEVSKHQQANPPCQQRGSHGRGCGRGGRGVRQAVRSTDDPEQLQGSELQGEQLHLGVANLPGPHAPPSLGAVAMAVKVIANTMRLFIDALKDVQGDRLATLPHGMVPVLHALCIHSTPRVAKLAALALAGVAEAEAVASETANGTRKRHEQQQTGWGGHLAAQTALKELAHDLAWHLTTRASTVAGAAAAGRGASKGKRGAQQSEGGESMGVRPMRALCALHALGSVGCIAPEIYAGYVEDVTRYVTHELLPGTLDTATACAALLPMELSDGNESGTTALAEEGESGFIWGKFSALASVKARALKALVKGCIPRIEVALQIPYDIGVVVEALYQLLESFMDVDNDMDALHLLSPMDNALMRLTAGKATLRLSFRHDSRMPSSAYCMLSLMVQDPVLEVRSQFAQALQHHIRLLMAQGLRPQASGHMSAGGWMPSKYAAMLPLAAVDPHEPNRSFAARGLVEYVAAKRRAARGVAQQAVLAASASGASSKAGGPGGKVQTWEQQQMQELPEFMLPFLVYLLTRHPDFPEQVAVDAVATGGLAPTLAAGGPFKAEGPKAKAQQAKHKSAQSGQSNSNLSVSQDGQDQEQAQQQREEEAEERQALLQPFSQMMQALLESLLLEGNGRLGSGVGPAADAAMLLPVSRAILEANKMLEMPNAVEDPTATVRMRSLCDLGQLLGRAIVERELHGKPGPSQVPKYPGQVTLPKALFNFAHLSGSKPKLRLGDHLPADFRVSLAEGVAAACNPFGAAAITAERGARKRGTTRAHGLGGKGKGRGQGAGRVKKEQKEGGGEESEGGTEGTDGAPPSHATKAARTKKGRGHPKGTSPAHKKVKA